MQEEVKRLEEAVVTKMQRLMRRQVDRGHSCGSKSHSGWHCSDGAKHRRRLQQASVKFKRSVPSEEGALNLESPQWQ